MRRSLERRLASRSVCSAVALVVPLGYRMRVTAAAQHPPTAVVRTFQGLAPAVRTRHPVRLVRLVETARCITCGEMVTVTSLSGGVCVVCFHPAGD